MANGAAARRPRRTQVEDTRAAPQRPRRKSTSTALARLDEDVLSAPPPLGVGRGRRVTRVIRLTTGWVVFGVGVIFVILPVIPGTPLVILAAFMLAPDVPVFARVLHWSKSRFSHVTTGLTDVNERFAEDFHRRFSS